MIAVTVTTQPTDPQYFLQAVGDRYLGYDIYHNDPDIGVVQAYQELWEKHCTENILIYMHDDVSIFDDDWVDRVCLEFLDPKVGIVGLGGGTGIGVPDIYKTPYRIEQLVRTGYASNQDGWEIHGEHELGERRVAVVDGFFMAVRGGLLAETGGWKFIQSNFHCYDLALCLEAYRRGWEVRIVGAHCAHHGGGTSTRPEYAEWCKERGTTMEEEHRAPHRWLYEEYRDMLPFRVEP